MTRRERGDGQLFSEENSPHSITIANRGSQTDGAIFFLFKIFCSNFSAPLAGILADVSVSALPKSGNKLFGGDLPLETRLDFSHEAPNVV